MSKKYIQIIRHLIKICAQNSIEYLKTTICFAFKYCNICFIFKKKIQLGSFILQICDILVMLFNTICNKLVKMLLFIKLIKSYIKCYVKSI